MYIMLYISCVYINMHGLMILDSLNFRSSALQHLYLEPILLYSQSFLLRYDIRKHDY